MIKQIIFSILIFQGFYGQSFGQVVPFLNEKIDPSRQNPDLLYGNNNNILGDPYLVEEYNLGNIKIEGEVSVFKNIKIKYDIYNDQLVINHRGAEGVLDSDHIENFTLYLPDDASYHSFVNVKLNNNPRFYEVIASLGEMIVYKKHYKNLVKGQPADGYNSGSLTKDKFVYADRYYLKKADGSLMEIDKMKKDLIPNLTEDPSIKKELNTFVKKNRIRFKDDQDIIAVFEKLEELEG